MSEDNYGDFTAVRRTTAGRIELLAVPEIWAHQVHFRDFGRELKLSSIYVALGDTDVEMHSAVPDCRGHTITVGDQRRLFGFKCEVCY